MSTRFTPGDDENDALVETFRADQDIEATAGRVAAYYKRLVDAGVSEDAAAQMTLTYNALTVAAHYGLDMKSMVPILPVFPSMEDWED